MKKILFLLFLLPAICFGQERMEFRGISFNCSISEFVSKLKSLGYKSVETDDNLVVMNGKFTGKDCDLYISSTPKTKKVCKVMVYFDKENDWDKLKGRYEEYRDLYKKKYGESRCSSYEFFKKPYYEGDGYELQALELDKCVYSSFFDTPAGYIVVKMFSGACINIGYEDKINIELRETEKESEALNEI